MKVAGYTSRICDKNLREIMREARLETKKLLSRMGPIECSAEVGQRLHIVLEWTKKLK